MSSQYALIYFIHDDIASEFEFILNLNILKAKLPSTIKSYLIYNKRIAQKTSVSYITHVSEIISETGKPTRLQPLTIRLIWQDAFNFVRNHLQENAFTGKTGLIILSHAAGVVINLNNEKVPITKFLNKNRDLLIRLRNRSNTVDAVYLRSRKGNSTFISTKTIVDNSSKTSGNQLQFIKKYIRKRGIPYCKKYEGLFTFQLSQFFKEENWLFEFIIFSNCNILLYDTGYLFAPFAKYIIGAESLSNMHTWDFPIIINTIKDNLQNPTRELLQQLFSACIDNFFRDRTERIYRYFLTETENFSSLHSSFEEVIKSIISNLEEPTFKAGILDWVSKAIATDDFIPLFDVLSFFEFANQIAGNKFTSSLNTFKTILTGKIIITRNSDEPAFCGYSLYLPRSEKEFRSIKGGLCNYFNPASKNEFTLNSKYDDLLLSLFS